MQKFYVVYRFVGNALLNSYDCLVNKQYMMRNQASHIISQMVIVSFPVEGLVAMYAESHLIVI